MTGLNKLLYQKLNSLPYTKAPLPAAKAENRFRIRRAWEKAV